MRMTTRPGAGPAAALMLSLGAAVACPAAAELYKWVDENGQVHYQDYPQDAKTREIRQPAAAAPGATPPDEGQRMEKTRRLLNAWELERQDERERLAEQHKQREELARKCREARDDLRSMTEAGGVYRLDDAGNRVYLGEQERAALERRYRDLIAANCR